MLEQDNSTFPASLLEPFDISEEGSEWFNWLMNYVKYFIESDQKFEDIVFGDRAFFGLLKSGDTQLDLEWESLEEDTRVVLELLTYLDETKTSDIFSPQNTLEVMTILRQSKLFNALASSSILVTREHVNGDSNGEKEPISPFTHSFNVLKSMDFSLASPGDEKLLLLIAWFHDIGKMAGVGFFSRENVNNRDSARNKIEEGYPCETPEDCQHYHPGSNSYPKHYSIGTAIISKLLINLKQDLDQLPVLNDDDASLLLNVIFHHHNFLYLGSEKSGDVNVWLRDKIEEKLLPTLPPDRPDLIVRFFELFIQLRLADIKATPGHHRHWQRNLEWMRQIPGVIFDQIFDYLLERKGDQYLINMNILEQIFLLEKLVEELPTELGSK